MLNAEPDTAPLDDLSTLAWVHDELRRSLESAHKALRRHLKEADALAGSDVDRVDPALLQAARAQLHQGVGALEMIGLPGPARVLRASEAVVQRMVARPQQLSAAVAETIEAASFGVLDYLGRKLAGKGLPTLALFPQYQKLLNLAGADRVHPADLWRDDWQWRELPDAGDAAPCAGDAGARTAMERYVLAMMRSPDRSAMARASELCAGLAAAASGRLAGLWRLAAGFYEAQAAGLLQPDIYVKRVSSRLLAQLRLADAGRTEVSDRLAQDLLFFCAHARAPADDAAVPRLAAVRSVYTIDDAAAFDYLQVRLGRFDPALIAQARKRVAGAKELWSAAAAGEGHRAVGLAEQFALVGESLQRLYPSGEVLAEALQRAIGQALAAAQPPGPALAMEVATAVLYLDASLEDGDFDQPQLAGRVRRLAQRIGEVAAGRAALPLEPWMEALYRRVSDRQTMGSVVQELRASLSEVEKQIDQYFRDPLRNEVLIPVPAQLQAMRGVLSVLDLEQASQAVLRMSEDVDALSQTEVDPQGSGHQPIFDRLADNLGALSFLIDMLSVQPQAARALFTFDPADERLRAAMGQRSGRLTAFDSLAEPAGGVPALVEQARSLARDAVSDADLQLGLQRLSQQAMLADQPALAQTMASAQAELARAGDDGARQAARRHLADAVAGFAPPAPPTEPAPAALRVTPPPGAVGDTGLEDDAEMRSIFVDEAREVLGAAGEALRRLVDAPDELGDLTLVRRAFHTLKGSARMVGLKDFGEAAWACEQLYNARLADRALLDPPLRRFTERALAELGGWVDAIAAQSGATADVAALVAAALALQPAPAAAAPPAPAADAAAAATAALRARVPELPSAADLDLDAGAAAADAASPHELAFTLDLQPPAEATPAAEELAFELDLDEPAAAEAAPAPSGAVAPPDLDEAGQLRPDFAPTMAFDDPAAAGFEPVDAARLADALPAVTTPVELDLAAPEEEPYKQIGDLRIGIPLFNIYLNEADELSRRLCTDLAEWGLESAQRPVDEATIALAHKLAGSSATVGYAELSSLARALEHALTRSRRNGRASPGEPELFSDVADEIRQLLHQFAAGFLRRVPPQLRRRLEQHTPDPTAAEPAAPADAAAWPDDALPLVEETDWPAELPPLPAAASQAAPADAAAVDAAAPVDEAAAVDAAAADDDLPGQTVLTAFADQPIAAADAVHAAADALDDEQDLDALDAVDDDLFPIFREEGEELLPQLQARMREWMRRPSDASAAAACMRTLHTFKGGARLAGAMRLGEMAHRLETAIEHLLARGGIAGADVEALLARVDTIATGFEQLGQPAEADAPPPVTVSAAAAAAPAATAAPAAVSAPAALPPSAADLPAATAAEAAGPAEVASAAAAAPATAAMPPPAAPPRASGAAAVDPIDWGRFAGPAATALPLAPVDKAAGSQGAVRVRAPLLDRLVNQAGEVSITRARIESDVGQIKGSLTDLTENLERLRHQLRDLELQAESQIASRLEAAKASAEGFDPLEMDRFTRFQELTRMMAESVNDVATVHRGLQRSLQATEDELASQARLTRDLQDDLLRTRMVEFESLADRLYRVVRQAAKETGKQVRLDIVGGAIEVDRGVLERMTGPFEHLLRNSVAHGIEPPAQRSAAGKDPTGRITIGLAQEGNEVTVEFRDDGAGLNLERIRARGVAQGLLAADAQPSAGELANLVFEPGFSTVDNVSELAGRGVGMDVVRAEVNAMGGRIETATAAGQGASFRLVLPLTTAVTQVVMLRCGELSVAVPSTLVEQVRRLPAEEVEQAYAGGRYPLGDVKLPFFWLGALLQAGARGPTAARTQTVVIVHSTAQRVAVHVDEVVGNQEVVVKNLGPQLSRLPGLAGITLLPSGAVALIYNPVALAATYGEHARARLRAQPAGAEPQDAAAAEARAPLVLVVDDSLTVRRVTQRLLVREGYRVALAKDGLDALDRLNEELPAVVLSDIEMPRMDGFDLVRNLRADARLAALPVIMITSRIAQKHRDYAAELGVNHYLGKPYAEEELLALVARYAHAAATV